VAKEKGYWVALKRCSDGEHWKVDGGSPRLAFLLGTDEDFLALAVNPEKWRFVWSSKGPEIGVRIQWDGVGVPRWPW
jgi:hypothetical protein